MNIEIRIEVDNDGVNMEVRERGRGGANESFQVKKSPKKRVNKYMKDSTKVKQLGMKGFTIYKYSL